MLRFVAYAGAARRGDRELPQRLHPALGRGAEAVGHPAAFALPQVRARPPAGTTTSRSSRGSLLRGRCRGCRQPISVQYPLIELATALLWAFMAWRYGFGLEALAGRAVRHPPARHRADRRARLHHSRRVLAGRPRAGHGVRAAGGRQPLGDGAARAPRSASDCSGWWRCSASGCSSRRPWAAATSR